MSFSKETKFCLKNLNTSPHTHLVVRLPKVFSASAPKRWYFGVFTCVLKCESTPLIIGNSLHHINATSDQAFCISCVHSVWGSRFKILYALQLVFGFVGRQERFPSTSTDFQGLCHTITKFLLFSLHPSRVPFAVYSLMCQTFQRSVICIVWMLMQWLCNQSESTANTVNETTWRTLISTPSISSLQK